MKFAGKTVLITGGAGGLGLETAKVFSNNGATVILLDVDATRLEQAKEEISNVKTVLVDLLDWHGTRQVLRTVGPVDHLVNNAAVLYRQSVMEATAGSIDHLLGVNFKAAVNVSQVVAEGMIASGKPGTIVNISSAASKVISPTTLPIYSSLKAGLNMLTRSMAQELAEHGIRVNAICPSYLETPLNQITAQRFEQLMSRTPLGRPLRTAEAAKAIMFLSSTASSMITGTTLDVDGGYVNAS